MQVAVAGAWCEQGVAAVVGKFLADFADLSFEVVRVAGFFKGVLQGQFVHVNRVNVARDFACADRLHHGQGVEPARVLPIIADDFGQELCQLRAVGFVGHGVFRCQS